MATNERLRLLLLIFTAVTLLCFCSCKLATPEDFEHAEVPRIPIDLRQPPSVRWDSFPTEMCEEFKQFQSQFEESAIKKLFHNREKLEEVEALVLKFVAQERLADYKEELFGLARKCSVSEGYVAMYNLMYEFGLLRGCTTILATDGERTSMFSNLDYDYFDYFSRTVFHGMWYDRGHKVLETRSLFGFLGFITASTHEASGTLNARAWTQDGTLTKFLEELKKGTLRPTLWELRNIYLSSHSYDEILAKVTALKNVAPSYISLTDHLSNRGSVITRNYEGTESVEELDSSSGKWYLVQGNLDRNTTVKDVRRRSSEESLKSLDPKDSNFANDVFTKIMSTSPVFNIGMEFRTISTSFHISSPLDKVDTQPTLTTKTWKSKQTSHSESSRKTKSKQVLPDSDLTADL